MSGLTTSIAARVRQGLVVRSIAAGVRSGLVVLSTIAVLVAAGLVPQAAQAYAPCSDLQLKVGGRWLAALWEDDCTQFKGRMLPATDVLSDGSRVERFEVAMLDSTCLQATMISRDFAPDVYIYDDAGYRHEVGVFQQRGNTATSIADVPSLAFSDAIPVLYVMTTSYGPGAQFGDYTLDLRTC